MVKPYILSEMTWPEVEEALKNIKVAVIPVGSQEQHGPYLQENCDTVIAEMFCKLVAEKFYPDIIVAPTINLGISFHHMLFPGTISLRPNTLIEVIRDICTSLKKHGIKKYLIINAHGGNNATLDVVTKVLYEDLDIQIAQVLFSVLSPNTEKKYIKSKYFGHACELEVSEILYLKPEILRKDLLQKGRVKDFPIRNADPWSSIDMGYKFNMISENGAVGDATKATKEIGQKICDEALDNLEVFIRDFIKYNT